VRCVQGSVYLLAEGLCGQLRAWISKERDFEAAELKEMGGSQAADGEQVLKPQSQGVSRYARSC
jgi:hypothetical protein